MIAATGYITFDYYQKESNLIPSYKKLMMEKALEYTNKLTKKFDDLEAEAIHLSQFPEIYHALETKSLFEKKDTHEKQELDKLTNTIKDYLAELEIDTFKNILLTDAEGKIIFSLNNPKYIGMNLGAQTQTQNQLTLSFQRAYMCLVPDISDFYFDKIVQEPALYITVPIFKNGTSIGFLVAHVNQSHIYKITQNYLGMGKTGEFVLGIRIKDGTQIIAPTRLFPNIAFKESSVYKPDIPIPLQSAVHGSTGVGIGDDYRNVPVIAAWSYIANAGWGLVAKIDYSEVIETHQNLNMIMIIMLFITCVLLLGLALSAQSIRNFFVNLSKNLVNTVAPRILVLCIALFFSVLCMSAGSIIYFKMISAQKTALQNAQLNVQSAGNRAVYNIENQLTRISLLAQGVASSLNSGRLTKDTITTNITRKMKEEPQLFAFCVAYKQTDLQKGFAPIVIRHASTITITDLATVLISRNLHPHFMEVPWFETTIKKNQPVWIQPTQELTSNKLVIIYAEPFYDPSDTEHKTPIGAVATMYAIDNLKPFLNNLSIGETGYPFIVNKEGRFISHPTEKYESDNTIFTIARQEGNIGLNTIDTHIIEGKEGLESYENEKTNQTFWVAYQPIPPINWSLGIVFVQDEINPSGVKLYHQKVWLVICAILALLCLTVAGASISQKPKKVFSIISSCIFVLGILAIWRLVQPQSTVSSGIVVTNSIGLDAYVDELKKNARQRFEPEPIPLPTGIYIESWKIVDATHVDIAGALWQQFDNKLHVGLAQEFDLPDATRVIKSDRYEEKEKNHTTVGWNVSATIAQQFDYSKYPLDSQRIRIELDHRDIEKNVLLIPDISNYDSLRPTDLPGIEKGFKYYGYHIQRSFFSIEKAKSNTNFGIQSYNAISEHMKLNFNIIITSDLLNALIIYFLPLMVILFSLFAIFAVTGRIGKDHAKHRIFVTLTGYTSLLFALIALHHALRGNYPSGNVLYLEYFFFYTYLTILILIIHGAIVQTEMYEKVIDEKVNPLMRSFFWPVQLCVWFITTVITFYN